jgi:molecular chaperone GrpE
VSKEAEDSSQAKLEAKGEDAEGLLQQERRRNEELSTKLKYLQADFENYRKRTEREMQEVEELSVRGIVARLLVILDELELAVENASKPGQVWSVSEGIKMVHRNLSNLLKTVGVRRIETVGMPFDPKLHEAVEKVQGSSDRDLVVDEVRSGYTLRGQVLRPSMVKVELASKKAEKPEAKTNE